MDDTEHQWLWRQTADRCIENLRKNDFDAHFATYIHTDRHRCFSDRSNPGVLMPHTHT
jgi:hypothetical protein